MVFSLGVRDGTPSPLRFRCDAKVLQVDVNGRGFPGAGWVRIPPVGFVVAVHVSWVQHPWRSIHDGGGQGLYIFVGCSTMRALSPLNMLIPALA